MPFDFERIVDPNTEWANAVEFSTVMGVHATGKFRGVECAGSSLELRWNVT
jgi:hypothetical protein